MEFLSHLTQSLESLKQTGLYKGEHPLLGPQTALIHLDNGKEILNLCSNNYLGLADHPLVVQAAKEALDEYGFGMASVRFICGTHALHKKLEATISAFYGAEDAILYPSCFDANTGLFETLLESCDAVISDALNHASIIDGIRLCKAQRFRYENNSMESLEKQLGLAQRTSRFILIASDGVFSMDGTLANVPKIRHLAKQYGALSMLDESHALGVLGKTGRGTQEHYHLQGNIDIVTGTLGKAMGGASGGYVTGKKEVIEHLRQRSRPYLFSNSLPAHIAAGALAAFKLLEKDPGLLERLQSNTQFMRSGLKSLGYPIQEGAHPIIPIILGDAQLAKKITQALLDAGIYTVSFTYPVVPKNQARIRIQISAKHTHKNLCFALDTFEKIKHSLGIFNT